LAAEQVKAFCSRTGINLAGFDLLFSSRGKSRLPLFLEINYYFGRRGLGGSERFYEILIAEIEKWIDRISLKLVRNS
jgi:ribosomal protein S6--L-glutamate ligase